MWGRSLPAITFSVSCSYTLAPAAALIHFENVYAAEAYSPLLNRCSMLVSSALYVECPERVLPATPEYCGNGRSALVNWRFVGKLAYGSLNPCATAMGLVRTELTGELNRSP